LSSEFRVQGFLKKHNVKGTIAVAVSGGIDSMALAFLLSQSHEVIVLIIDHGLRAASSAEATKTAKILDGLGIENTILRKKHSIKANLQEEARKLRYGLLLDYCKKHKIKYLAIAHHAEDNAETFLLRLSRGSGLDGLSGIAAMSEMQGVKIIRPVLDFSKAELKKILVANKIKWVEDPTNRTDKYKRNKLRLALGKLEDKELVTARINDAAANLARVRGFIELETEKAYNSCVSGNILDPKKLEKLHDEIAYRVLVNVIMRLSGREKKPRFEKLKRLKDDLVADKTRTLNGLIFRPKKGKIIILREAGAEPAMSARSAVPSEGQ